MSEQRLQSLETVVRALREEVRQLRAEVGRLGGGDAPRAGVEVERALRSTQGEEPGGSAEVRGGAPAAVPRFATPAARAGAPPDLHDNGEEPWRAHRIAARRSVSRLGGSRGLGLEAMVGRYGTLAVAAVLVVMGVGAFVTWAASRIVIGPGMRIMLGALAAFALAVLGRRLERRGAAAFGSTLLALALAVAHVDAWAAGPVLHVVPNVIALGAAAVASVALAALALRERNEALFAVGVGGALLAPFVAGDRETALVASLIYGWVVLASALVATRPREWGVTTRLAMLGVMVYAAAAVAAPPDTLTESMATGAFPLACAWAAYLWGGDRHRVSLALGFLAMSAGVLLILVMREPVIPFVGLAVAGTASNYLMIESRAASRSQVVAGGLVLPLAFLLAALAVVEFAQAKGVFVAAGWVVAAVTVAVVSRGRRDWHLAMASCAGLLAIAAALRERPVACIVGLAVGALVSALLVRRADARAPLLPLGIALLVSGAWSYLLLVAREAFAYRPFMTGASVAAGAVVAAAFAAWRFTRHVSAEVGVTGAVAFGGALFLWGRAELERAIRPDVATFTLILYYAAAGVAAIALGRQRGIGELRAAGIALALYAAAKAVVQASGLTTIGLRVGSYLLVGSFLLAVAYWYRAVATRPADQPAVRTSS